MEKYDDMEKQIFDLWQRFYVYVPDIPRKVRWESLRKLRREKRKRARLKKQWKLPEWALPQNITQEKYNELVKRVAAINDRLSVYCARLSSGVVNIEFKEALEGVTNLLFEMADDWRTCEYILDHQSDFFEEEEWDAWRWNPPKE